MRNADRDEALLATLREIAAEQPTVTVAAFALETGITVARIYRRFGSWTAMRERAGLPAFPKRSHLRGPSAADIRSALREVVDASGPDVTRAEFTRRTGIGAATIHARFGTWTALRESEDLRPVHRVHPRRIAADTIRAALREAIRELGSGLTQREFCRHSGFSPSVIHARFGGWKALLAGEGINATQRPPRARISDEQLVAEYRRVEKLLGRRPTYTELGHLSYHAASTFRRRFELFGWRRRIRNATRTNTSPGEPL